MIQIADTFIQKIPKTDIHLHLDGSLRIPSLIELAQQDHVKLPAYSEEGLKELVFKERYENLGEYLTGFAYTVGVLQKLENLERVAFELAEDCYAEGVRYIEVRFAPQLHVSRMNEIADVTKAVNNGLHRAKLQLNSTMRSDDMPFEYGIILCAMRRFNKQMSPYYERMLQDKESSLHRYSYSRASRALVKEAIQLRDAGIPVVGFDLAGEEAGYPANHHKAAFQHAHRNFLRKTVHAGEAYGPESIFQAITECHANRIGHGTFLFDAEAIQSRKIKDKAQYVKQLSEYIANQRITIEVCPTSNLQTTPAIDSLTQHPVRLMIENNLAVSINTDNRLVSNTNATKELSLVAHHLELSPDQFRNIALAGFKGSFFPGSYAEKRKYVRRAINLYEGLERLYLQG
jgi:adenosine deaminase